MKNFILLSAAAISISAAVIVEGDPKKAPDNWYNLSMKDNKVFGVQTEKTYNELLKGKTPDTIIVAVMDGGVDYTHEDLKSVMWVNKGEIAGNGVDDDKNGYVDDIHGWNFIGGKNGENVNYDNLELLRLLRYKQKL